MTGQCSILYINTCEFSDSQTPALRALGFDVVEVDDVPARDSLANHHGVIVRMRDGKGLTSVAARLRSAPLFGRRVLIALVPSTVPVSHRRDAVHSGFDVVLPEQCSARDLAAAILSLLRRYPEHRCVLRTHKQRRGAAA